MYTHSLCSAEFRVWLATVNKFRVSIVETLGDQLSNLL